MRIKGRGLMVSNPDFRVAAKIDPIPFTASARGKLQAHAGPFQIQVDRIPVAIRIPFLRRRRSLVIIAEIGGFGLNIAPIQAALEEVSVAFGGVLGEKEGLSGKLSGDVGCKTTMEVDGRIHAKGSKLTLALDHEDDDTCESEGS